MQTTTKLDSEFTLWAKVLLNQIERAAYTDGLESIGQRESVTTLLRKIVDNQAVAHAAGKPTI